jgi:predicted GIY-YIG superfamily endonuclease
MTDALLPFGSYQYNIKGEIAKVQPETLASHEAATDSLQSIYDEQQSVMVEWLERLPVMQSTAVYRYYDGDGALLYVGIAHDFGRRDQQHIERSRWRHMATLVRAELFPWRYTALSIEGCAIQHEDPIYNADRRSAAALTGLAEKKLYRKSKGVVSGHVSWLKLKECKEPWGPWSRHQ